MNLKTEYIVILLLIIILIIVYDNYTKNSISNKIKGFMNKTDSNPGPKSILKTEKNQTPKKVTIQESDSPNSQLSFLDDNYEQKKIKEIQHLLNDKEDSEDIDSNDLL